MSGSGQQRKAIGAAVLVLAGTLFLAGCGGRPQRDGPSGSAPDDAAGSKPVIAVENAWARPARAAGDMGMTSAVYFVLRNTGPQDDALIGAGTEVAGKAEIHETVAVESGSDGKTGEGDAGHGGMEDDMASQAMKMHPVESVPLPAGGAVEFRPGGLHVMLMDLKRDLAVGERFAVTLRFAGSPAQTVEVVVREP